MMSETLSVYYNDALIGALRITKGSQYVFTYSEQWLGREDATPISISMPLTPGDFDEEKSMAFFSNLLPESKIRETLANKLRVDKKDSYGLLEIIGGECAGALSIVPVGEDFLVKGEHVEIPLDELGSLLEDLSKKPFLAGEEGVRLSLAGAQDKLPVYFNDGVVYLPKGAYPSSHIIKPKIGNGFPHSVINEAFCMLLANELALPVPDVRVIRNAGEPFYLIERYDRFHNEEGKVVRLHQEDFCQALGVSPEHKYEENGGPSLSACFKLIEENCANPAIDKLSLIKWVMFNILISNADAHAKNLALLYEGGAIALAPFYDLLCTSSDVYKGLTDVFSMKIGSKKEIRYLSKHDWKKLANDIGVKYSLFPDLCAELLDELNLKIAKVKDGMSLTEDEERFVGDVEGVIDKRTNFLQNTVVL